MKSVLDQEIAWCRANRGKSGKGKAFEDGFIAGLKQAKFLCAAQLRVHLTAATPRKTGASSKSKSVGASRRK